MPFKILTANRLTDGLVLYLGPEGWTQDIDAAERATNDNAAAVLEDRGKAAAAANEIADPYLIDMADDGPERWRETIRAAGPTVRPDLGYQAQVRS
ncbi:MAG: DUF2849 domain-containing protein [Alphaproteobacteria bacterium]